LFGLDLDPVQHPERYALFCLLALALVAVLASNIRRGRAGRRLVAVRANERAAASLGISVFGAKLYSFALSAGIAGLGGVLLAFRSTFVDFNQFTVLSSIATVINTVIGGIGYLLGGLMGGMSTMGGVTPKIFSEIIPSTEISEWVTLVLALLLIPTLIQFPDGLMARATKWRPKWVRERTQANRRARAAELHETTPAAEPHRVRPQVLQARDVEVRFGGVVALKGVSLDVNPGEVVGLMGPNGAGKTTFIDAVTGFTRIRGGTISLDGDRIEGLTARKRARAGVGRTFQSLELFDQLTVMENLRTASDPRDAAAYVTDLVHPSHSGLTPAARSAIEMFALAEDLHRVPTELPYGRRRQVAIARAIAAEPSILLLDEPAAGLDEGETRELALLIRRMVEEWGIGVLLVEHDVPMLTTVCDRIVVVDFGEVIATGTPAEIRADDRVVAAYLGGAAQEREEVGDVH
jgi:ABC-type branched-subunit amino acid transport system ATPase component